MLNTCLIIAYLPNPPSLPGGLVAVFWNPDMGHLIDVETLVS